MRPRWAWASNGWNRHTGGLGLLPAARPSDGHQRTGRFAAAVIADLAHETGLPLTEASNHFEAQGGRDALVELSGQLRVVAVSLTRSAPTCAGSAADRAPGSARSPCPTCSRGRTSCRARSTRFCPKRR